MKIGIITQRLGNNYGGLIQNYALQETLRRLGHTPMTINQYLPYVSKKEYYIAKIKYYIKRLIGRPCRPLTYTNENELKARSVNTYKFIQQHISCTKKVTTKKEYLKTVFENDLNAIVVGSDQIWRPMYNRYIERSFLDFTKGLEIKRVAYAASFGVDNWEFNEEQTKKCSELAKLFNAISVREDSGMHLCKEYLGVDAIQVLDPTLLLEKEDYIELVNKANERLSDGDLFCYILDDNEMIKNAINKIEKNKGLKSFQVIEKKLCEITNIEDYIVPSPTKWLRAFMDAKMVFTDSFHGCVFSIIFNKPFWVIGNKGRGNARFDSLLKLFNLECRRVDINDIDNIDFTAPIDWNEVNTIKKAWQEKSINFIKEYL